MPAGPTVKSLDERIDDLEQVFHSEIGSLRLDLERQVASVKEQMAEFRGRMETSLNLAKWITSFAGLVIVSLIAFGWQFSATNGRLEQKVVHLQEDIAEIKALLQKQK